MSKYNLLDGKTGILIAVMSKEDQSIVELQLLESHTEYAKLCGSKIKGNMSWIYPPWIGAN